MSSTRGCDRSACKACIRELVRQEPQICHKKPEILTWQVTQMKLKPRTDLHGQDANLRPTICHLGSIGFY